MSYPLRTNTNLPFLVKMILLRLSGNVTGIQEMQTLHLNNEETRHFPSTHTLVFSTYDHHSLQNRLPKERPGSKKQVKFAQYLCSLLKFCGQKTGFPRNRRPRTLYLLEPTKLHTLKKSKRMIQDINIIERGQFHLIHLIMFLCYLIVQFFLNLSLSPQFHNPKERNFLNKAKIIQVSTKPSQN